MITKRRVFILLVTLWLMYHPAVTFCQTFESDSLALVALYNETGGVQWPNNDNWLEQGTALEDWFGVTLTDNRVSALDLPNNGLQDTIPEDLLNMDALVMIDFSGNAISSIPVLAEIPALTILDVSDNSLQFGDLEPNVSITNFTYDTQDFVGEEKTVRIPQGDTYEVVVEFTGENNTYQWLFNDFFIDGATEATYTIESVDFETMGLYTVIVENSTLPDLVLASTGQTVMAVANLGGAVARTVNQQPITEGDAILFEITPEGGKYDSITTVSIGGNGRYGFSEINLADYVVLARTGLEDANDLLQTYVGNVIKWTQADTIRLRESRSDGDVSLDIAPEDFTSDDGDAMVQGALEVDIPDGGRTLARRRVVRAAVFLSRSRIQNRPLQEEFELVAATETDENGQFSFENVPEGNYLLNIQIPGVPMDVNSFVEFTIEQENEAFDLLAVADEVDISVERLMVSGLADGRSLEILVFPNPTEDRIVIRMEAIESTLELKAQVYDLAGKYWMEQNMSYHQALNGFQLDLKALPTGVYLLAVADEKNDWRHVVKFSKR